MRRILEGVKRKNLPAVLVFIDYCKAFDSINHATMFKILEAYSIPLRLRDAIKLTYQNLQAKVCSPDGDTDLFKMHAGVMQGDTLAPFLFVIVLDYALRKAIDGKEEELGFTLDRRRSRRVAAKAICDLDFVDDIVLPSNQVEQARQLLLRVETECKDVGLRLNVKKTKSMFYNAAVEDITTLDGEKVEQALLEDGEQDFKYLGSWVEQKRDIQTRKALAWSALRKLEKIWKSTI